MAKYKVNINFINTNKLKTIASEKTKELIKKYKEGDESAREKAALLNLKLVLSIVNRFAKRCDNLDDLFQIGFIGLLKSIDNFDINQNVAFSTYAVPMIEGEIRRYLRDDSLIRVSRQIKDLSYKVLRHKENMMEEYGYIPSIDELSEKLEEKKTKIVEAHDVNIPLVSLEEPLYLDGDDSLLLEDTIFSYEEERKKEYSYLYEGLEHLSPLEKDIIKKRYFEGKSQIEIATKLNISQAQVSRIEKGALKFLKKYVQ